MGTMVPGGRRYSMCPFSIIAVILSVIFKVAGQDKVTCDVPSVKALTATSLTCHFPEDISQTRRDVSVYLYKENQSPDAILDCWWLGGNIDCFAAPGYEHTKSISRELTVTIPRAAANQTGTYACQLAGYGPSQLTTCDFTIESGTKTICDAPSVRQGSPAWLSCYFSENVGKSKKDFIVYHVSSQDFKESVLTCTWVQGSLTCSTAPDYQFDRKVTNTATVKIPKVSASHTGTYSCQLSGATPGDYEDCVFSLDKGKGTSCNIPPVKLMEPATITCNFTVDVNKTKTNFKVVHFSDQNKTGVEVVKCVWRTDELICDMTSGFEFSRPVTDRLAITIPRANVSHVGEYLCQHQRTSSNATRCEFIIDSGSDSNVSVIVGVLIALIILVMIVVGILLYRRFPVRKKHSRATPTREEKQPMLPIQVTDQTTQGFQESLSASITTMYPDNLTACYFVPPLYINRNTYTNAEVAGEKVVVMEPAPDETLRQDQAIQHVLTCLRHLADRDKEAMFVLSQFNYDNYVASVDEEFSQHKLPMPSDLKRRDKRYETFDVLIVHRHYGVVAVVVKASACTADMGVDLRDNSRVVEDLQEAVKQLNEAERMLKHLMSDLRPDISIRKTLMLPNLSLKSFREILAKHQEIAKALKHCTGLTELFDMSGECLCSDQLHSDNMVDQLHEWLQRHTTGSSTDPNFSENNYQSILSRFCGGATRPFLMLPDGRRVLCTPSSLQQAVSLTGDLFNGDIIHPEHHQLLTEAPPRVFLSGPPGSGKTTSLLLIGKKWLFDGHKVCVLATWRENRISSKLLHGMLKEFLETRGKSREPKDLQEVKVESSNTKKDSKKVSDQSKDIRLIFKEVDLEKREMRKVINEMKKLSTSDGLFILVDDAGPHREDQPLFKSFCEQLIAVNQDLHLWAASCLTHQIPRGWDVKHFQRTVSCPPTILREKNLLMLAQKKGCKNLIKWDPDNIGVAPTEGLPVKYIYHHVKDKEGHDPGFPFACEKCCKDVVALLIASGLETNAGEVIDNCQTTSTSTATSPNCDSMDTSTWTPRLSPTDVLVLFELCEDEGFYKNTKFCKTLEKSGFSIKIMKNAKNEFSSKNFNHFWISNPTDLRGLKRKVVVYVEGPTELQIPLEWMRLRGVTSCTSQLIWVKDVASSHPEASS